MDESIQKFIAHVREASENPDFIHHKWFVKYHLEIVEQIAMELCDKYPNADRDFVKLLVWLHDYGKILDFDNQYQTTLEKGREKLIELGFDEEAVNRAAESMEIIDRKDRQELEKSSIEIKIVSSADGASHHIGPFYALWWYENADKEIPQLMQDNIDKLAKDWDRKMVLPEVREAFDGRRKMILEMTGKFPEKYLS